MDFTKERLAGGDTLRQANLKFYQKYCPQLVDLVEDPAEAALAFADSHSTELPVVRDSPYTGRQELLELLIAKLELRFDL